MHDEGLAFPAHERRDSSDGSCVARPPAGSASKLLGLGLAIVSHIAEAHHGAVELESAEGAGSTFRLVIPSAPSTVTGTVEPWPAS